MGCGNQKTRQGDCDAIKFSNMTTIVALWKPKDPPRGLRLIYLTDHKGLLGQWKPKDPPRGLRLRILLLLFLFFLLSGNQKTRQGDCDHLPKFDHLYPEVETKRPAKGIATYTTISNSS